MRVFFKIWSAETLCLPKNSTNERNNSNIFPFSDGKYVFVFFGV